MFRNHSVAVVVPARNESQQLPGVLSTLPRWVDRVIVVDDGSQDSTARLVAQASTEDPRVRLRRHEHACGVGAAIATGYLEALEEKMDLVAVMAGDGQMDPRDLPAVLLPLTEGEADYVKGSRFAWPDGRRKIPPLRRAGIAALASLTRLATGYRHITDCQCGFTGVAGSALRVLRPERLYAGYGYPNDLLSRCSANGLRVAEVPVRPRYGVGEHSKMRIPHVVLPILSLLVRALLRRLVRPAVARSVARESVGGR